MPMDKANKALLASSKLLRGLSRSQLGTIAALLRVEEHPAGELITRESQPADRVYLLAEGCAEVLKRLSESEEARIGSLAPGDFFGETSIILHTDSRSASVRATSTVKVFSVSREDFAPLLEQYPEIMRNVLSNVIIQLRLMDDTFVETLRLEKRQLEQKVGERTRQIEAINERVHRELALAQNIQRNLLPEKRKDFPGVSIATEYIPCDELGGDIAGVFRIDETRIGVYGGDVCGHGIYAAMVMSYVKKLIETSVKRVLLNRQYVVKPPGAVLTAINGSFIAEINQGDPEIYLTLFLGVLDTSSLRFEYSSAGTHVPPLVISRGGIAELFDRSDYPIGHVLDHEFETRRTTFAPGDGLLFVSDGVTEASRGGRLFGMDKLKAEVLRIATERGELDLGELIASLRLFLGGEAPQDDMCFLSMSFGDSKPADGAQSGGTDLDIR
jgi:serine phosphatase RsbU (regulator of sigma subunit)